MATTEPKHEHREEGEEAAGADDEDTGAQVAPIVRLEEVAVSTGEENEDPVIDLKAQLYRFDKDGNQWKERGTGTVKLLKHKETGKVRLVMRQSKTLKICANHLVLPAMTLQEHAGNEKSCVWHAPDFADGELKDELFCLRFASIENCKSFMEMFQEVAESQKIEESEDGSTAAGLLEKLSVEDKSEEKAEDKTKEGDNTVEKAEDKDTERRTKRFQHEGYAGHVLTHVSFKYVMPFLCQPSWSCIVGQVQEVVKGILWGYWYPRSSWRN